MLSMRGDDGEEGLSTMEHSTAGVTAENARSSWRRATGRAKGDRITMTFAGKKVVGHRTGRFKEGVIKWGDGRTWRRVSAEAQDAAGDDDQK